MNNLILLLTLTLVTISCGKKVSSDSLEQSTIVESECLDKQKSNYEFMSFADIAQLSYYGVIECGMSKKDVLNYIKNIEQGDQNE